MPHSAPQPRSPHPERMAVGHLNGRVLVHLDRPRDFLNVDAGEALTLAYQLVAAARAAGANPSPQRVLF